MLHIWNPQLQFAYSLYNFYGAIITINGGLLLRFPLLCGFQSKNFTSRQSRSHKWRSWSILNFVLLSLTRHNLADALAVRTHTKQKQQNSWTWWVHNFTHIWRRNHREIKIKLCLLVGIHDVVKCTKFGDGQLRGLGMGRGQTSHFSIDLSGPP